MTTPAMRDGGQALDASQAISKADWPPPAISTSGAPDAASAVAVNLDESAEIDGDDRYAMRVNDPWEGYNRRMYKFNSKVDKYIARPVGVAYDTVVPDVVQRHVTSVFANLEEPRTLINQLLQGRPIGAARTLGRFVVNTTAGVGGIFDPASKLELHRANEDLGQTLAVWGWKDSRFFVAPLMGPKTVRDAISGFGDSPLNPTGYIDDKGISMAVTIIKIGSMRSAALPLEKMRAEALDEYSFVRDAWMQRRSHQINEK
ncbi:MlaA family lipoprotein [Allopusillimonas ginsengisoli]|uniref:MlaA family lipoprotein n=1 Tax=Allopusillimonas ginsengisoli TaxID=453575 RepID=UPI00143220C9|nr:VacJ family lipoprotein [Allopusillimonas ginsengisoli]